MNTETLQKYQRLILEQGRRVFYKTPISQATERAYFAAQRHLFVRRYRQWGSPVWREVTAENLEQHLAMLYADSPLVLRMLDMLQLQPGQTVFELGAGSGWNAALIGHLVGPEGRVFSLEIIPDVANDAANAVQKGGIKNVKIVTADGGDGHLAGAPYDRVIFTAGAYDLPRAFHDQLKDGGLVMAVIKIEGGGDNLFVLRKTQDHFESVDSMSCAFVQLTGKYQNAGLEPAAPETLPDWPELREVSRTRFWWAGKGQESFAWRTMGIRFFLGISEPRFRAFKTEKAAVRPLDDHYFGLWNQEQRSLVLAKDDWLIAYGNDSAREQLLAKVQQWVNLGMPAAPSFKLQVHRNDYPVERRENQWIVKRSESTFLWTLEG
jgi:protein-L-isoaspartate(D-aspartate) O-methyltransferase